MPFTGSRVEAGQEQSTDALIPLGGQRRPSVAESHVRAASRVHASGPGAQFEIDLEDFLDGRHAVLIARIDRNRAAALAAERRARKAVRRARRDAPDLRLQRAIEL